MGSIGNLGQTVAVTANDDVTDVTAGDAAPGLAVTSLVDQAGAASNRLTADPARLGPPHMRRNVLRAPGPVVLRKNLGELGRVAD